MDPIKGTGTAEGPGCSASNPATWVISFGRVSGVGSVSWGKGKRCSMKLVRSPSGRITGQAPGIPQQGYAIGNRITHLLRNSFWHVTRLWFLSSGTFDQGTPYGASETAHSELGSVGHINSESDGPGSRIFIRWNCSLWG